MNTEIRDSVEYSKLTFEKIVQNALKEFHERTGLYIRGNFGFYRVSKPTPESVKKGDPKLFDYSIHSIECGTNNIEVTFDPKQ